MRRMLVVAVVAVAAAVGVLVAQSGGLGSNDHAHGSGPIVVNSVATTSTLPVTSTTFPAGSFVDRRLPATLKLNAGFTLLSPPRAEDVPTISAASALYPTDWAGTTWNLGLARHVRPVVMLARYTDVISTKRPDHEVDVLAWVVVYNNVEVHHHGLGPNPLFPGYDVIIVDATSGRALTETMNGPPFSDTQLGI